MKLARTVRRLVVIATIPVVFGCPSLLLAGSAASANAAAHPRTWPVRYSEDYHFERQTMGQLTLSWEGIKARRFYLVLDAQGPFQATLVRDRDASMLFHGRRASHHESLVDWGRGELAHLTVSTDLEAGLSLTLRVATDPSEQGLAIYSFQVNRFLRLFDQEREKAVGCLVQALAEDPQDTTAAFLWRKLEDEKGLTVAPRSIQTEEDEQAQWLEVTEGARVLQLDRAVAAALGTAGADSARALLDRAAPFSTPRCRAHLLRLRATAELQDGQAMLASSLLYEALDTATDPTQRFELLRGLVAANRALGNEEQAQAVIDRAIAEAPDDERRRQARSWRK